LHSHTRLFTAGSFDVKLNHIVIIGVLVLAFSISFLIRSQPANYGSELNEFDPFFNFRATEYLVENGFSEYFNWHDDKSWHPEGRNVSKSSQVMLHVTAAYTYQIFGGNSSLYDFTIIFPVIIGSLTVVIIFALVRLIGGTIAGLFASLLFAVSLPILIRGSVGWFKSEPLGLFYGLLGLYLFLSAIKSENKKIAALKIIFGGIALAFGMASWGGNQFFIIPIGLFILALPFLKKDHKFLLWSIPLFVGVFLLISGSFERPGLTFVFGLGGLSLIIPTMFLIGSIFVQKISKDEAKIRNSLFLLFSIIIIGSFLIIINEESNLLPLPSFRYLNALNPFLTTIDPLVDSVAEHATTSIQLSFLFHSVLMIFSGLGIWILLSKKISQTFVKNDMKVFVLIIGVTGVYVSSSFIRLEVFASISLIILSSIALSILTQNIFKIKFLGKKNYLLKISYVVIILFLFTLPLVVPENSNWIDHLDSPPIILTGGTSYPPTNEWLDTLEWIKLNTTEDAVIASWWDYGYWITTMSERTTLADNATIDAIQIQKIAKIFFSSPDEAWNQLNEMDSDYVLVFIAGQKVDTSDSRILYLLNGGGDESKKVWFAKIAGKSVQKYIQSDGISGTDIFWNDTILGKMHPFSLVGYVHPANEILSPTYVSGYIPVYMKDVKYPSDGNGPLRLVYSSSSFNEEKIGPMLGIFVYEINKDYVPSENSIIFEELK
jgi:dolichyl-diphosphooligosaccharide---protein glycosyltransferase